MLIPQATKRLMVKICHLLAEKDYVSAMDGNVSCRLPDGRILATPTMVPKAFVAEEDLIVVGLDGTMLEGREGRSPTSEIFMHLAVYARRPDVHAVVHAHPPTAVALTIAGENLERCILPEVVATLGKIPTAPYRTAGSRELAAIVGDLMTDYDAVLLERHGALCAGRDLVDAYGKMEKVEHSAIITHKARMLGRVQELDCAEVDKLRQMGVRYSSRLMPPPACEGCPSGVPEQDSPEFVVAKAAGISQAASSGGESIERIVAEEIVRALSGRL